MSTRTIGRHRIEVRPTRGLIAAVVLLAALELAATIVAGAVAVSPRDAADPMWVGWAALAVFTFGVLLVLDLLGRIVRMIESRERL